MHGLAPRTVEVKSRVPRPCQTATPASSTDVPPGRDRTSRTGTADVDPRPHAATRCQQGSCLVSDAVVLSRLPTGPASPTNRPRPRGPGSLPARSSPTITRAVQPLSSPDSAHLKAAEGWLDLGNLLEADAELDQIAAENRAHPDVLQLRWRIYAAAGRWHACLDIATALTAMVPERRFGWVHRAFTLRKLDRPQEALAVYAEAIERLGMSPTLALGLACCHAKLGDMVETKRCLELALDLSEDKETQKRLKLKALEEPDLEPFWKRLGAPGE